MPKETASISQKFSKSHNDITQRQIPIVLEVVDKDAVNKKDKVNFKLPNTKTNSETVSHKNDSYMLANFEHNEIQSKLKVDNNSIIIDNCTKQCSSSKNVP